MRKLILFSLLIVFGLTVVTAQKNPKKKDPVGTWKFEAPYSPEGYTSGTIVFGLAKRKYTASVVFNGSEAKLSGGNVKVENDSLFFVVYIDKEEVTVRLKIENELKMSGKAVYSQGEVPFTLNKPASAVEVKGETKK